jgi:hypothetical protein
LSLDHESTLVSLSSFIQATRDSGYRGLPSALAELIDNSFEAKAKKVAITFVEEKTSGESKFAVVIGDDGTGMKPSVLKIALQFGGSTRFNSRQSAGRYGMGLPNSSLSQARHVEVYSWTRRHVIWRTHLDVDEVVSGLVSTVPTPKRVEEVPFANILDSEHGTVVVWKQCDRLDVKRIKKVIPKLRVELGRIFRVPLCAGKSITIDGEDIQPIDPLFQHASNGLVGGIQYGPPLKYEIQIPGNSSKATSAVTVRFVELPIERWHNLSNEEKRQYGIAKGAGVTVLRADREIDRGWLFMGSKRKENYDDWWRCEVSFRPELDELFGVTHTKQEIHPTEILLSILVPDIEKIARELNARARQEFFAVKKRERRRASEKVAERYDNLIEPPRVQGTGRGILGTPLKRGSRGRVKGLEYRLKFDQLGTGCFYEREIKGSRLTVALNDTHPFVRSAYLRNNGTLADIQNNLELMVLAAARAELLLARDTNGKKWAQAFRQSWSNVLATFLS